MLGASSARSPRSGAVGGAINKPAIKLSLVYICMWRAAPAGGEVSQRVKFGYVSVCHHAMAWRQCTPALI